MSALQSIPLWSPLFLVLPRRSPSALTSALSQWEALQPPPAAPLGHGEIVSENSSLTADVHVLGALGLG